MNFKHTENIVLSKRNQFKADSSSYACIPPPYFLNIKSISLHPLLWMNVMLDFIVWASPSFEQREVGEQFEWNWLLNVTCKDIAVTMYICGGKLEMKIYTSTRNRTSDALFQLYTYMTKIGNENIYIVSNQRRLAFQRAALTIRLRWQITISILELYQSTRVTMQVWNWLCLVCSYKIL